MLKISQRLKIFATISVICILLRDEAHDHASKQIKYLFFRKSM
jgi:hypothetical protein